MMKRIRHNPRGMTLIEILITLTILAVLMAAIGVAFEGAMKSYTTNDALFKTINAARQSLMRITYDVRNASIDSGGNGGVSEIGAGSGQDIDNRICTIQLNNEIANGSGSNNVSYHFNTSTAASYDNALNENTLYLKINNGDLAGEIYTLCRNVTDMTFDRDATGGSVRNVQISMTVQDDSGTLSQTLNAAAVIRSNIE